jgi:hypothetical protein
MTVSGVAGFYYMENLRRQRQNLRGVTNMVVVRNPLRAMKDSCFCLLFQKLFV